MDVVLEHLRIGRCGMGRNGMIQIPAADCIQDIARAGVILVIDPVGVRDRLVLIHVGSEDDFLLRHIDDSRRIAISRSKVMQFYSRVADGDADAVGEGLINLRNIVEWRRGEVENRLTVHMAVHPGLGKDARPSNMIIMLMRHDDMRNGIVGERGDKIPKHFAPRVICRFRNQNIISRNDHQAVIVKCKPLIHAISKLVHHRRRSLLGRRAADCSN